MVSRNVQFQPVWPFLFKSKPADFTVIIAIFLVFYFYFTCNSDWLTDNPSDIISVLRSSTNEILIFIISVVRFPTTVNPSNDSTNSVMAAALPEMLLMF